MSKKKKDEYGFPTGIKPQHRNGKINPRSKNYDQDLADRRQKEKARRKTNQKNRRR